MPHGDFPMADFVQFADACRLDDKPVSLSLLLDLLIEEFNVSRSLRAQAIHGRTLLREAAPDGTTTISGTITMPATPDDRRRVRKPSAYHSPWARRPSSGTAADGSTWPAPPSPD